MPTRNVNPTEHFDLFIEADIKSGRLSSASEVVREGLGLLEQRDHDYKAKIDWLRAAGKEGFGQLDRGEGIEFESMDDLDAHIDKIGEEVAMRSGQRLSNWQSAWVQPWTVLHFFDTFSRARYNTRHLTNLSMRFSFRTGGRENVANSCHVARRESDYGLHQLGCGGEDVPFG